MADILIAILLFTFKLALLVKFKLKINVLLIFELKYKVSMANLKANKRILKCQPFWHVLKKGFLLSRGFAFQNG